MELVRSPDNVWINLGNWSSTQLELVSTTLLFSTDSALPCSFQHKFKPYHPWPVNGLLRLGNVLEGANTSWKEVQTQTTLGPQRCQSQESISSRRLFPWVNHLPLRPPSLLDGSVSNEQGSALNQPTTLSASMQDGSVVAGIFVKSSRGPTWVQQGEPVKIVFPGQELLPRRHHIDMRVLHG